MRGELESELTATQLVIPKFHGEKLTDIPDEQLAECLVCIFYLNRRRKDMR